MVVQGVNAVCAGEVKMMRNVDSQSRLSGRIRKRWCGVQSGWMWMDGGARKLDRPGVHSMLRGRVSVGSANQRALAVCWAGVEWLCRGWRWRRGCCMRRRGMQRHDGVQLENAASESNAGNNGEAGALHQPRIGDPIDILACGARRSLRRGDARGLVTK